MNSESSATEKVLLDLLDMLESAKYTELIELAWKSLYEIVIPFNTKGIHLFLSNYIIILSQTLSIESTAEEASRILSILDLIIHPRKGTIIEGESHFDDLVEEVPSAPCDTPETKDVSLDKNSNKKVKIDIIE
ncbi:hypothetical protein NEAUS03_0283 [Nematocida ausubeli]|nr:hypothetical protein NEAUS03_0283 [Nematocida ausubeli]